MTEAIGLIAGSHDMTMVGEPIEQGGRHLGVAKDLRPFRDGQVRRDDDAGVLTGLTDGLVMK